MRQFSNFLNPILTKSFKKTYLFPVLLLLTASVHAKTYYVSNDGNNSNSGTSTSSPWQTVSKINSFSFSAGDIILFRRGDVFRGGIVLKRSNLTFGAYGSGNKPVITGLTTVSGWVDRGSNIWEASVSNVKKMVNLVLRDGTPQQVGRYPNTTASNGGYLTFTSSTSKSITGSANSSTTDWTGAEVVFKANRWTINRQIVTDHSGGTVYFASNPTTPRVNFGYFFQRDARTLDKDGEWFYNSSTSKLRMYFGNDNPNSYDIQIATVDTLFKCQYYNNIEVSDLYFEGAGVSSIWFNGGSNVSVRDCDVINSGKEAIVAKSTMNSSVENCTATNNLCTGIDVTDYGDEVNLVVKNCTVTNTAYIAGMEANNQSGGEGIRCMGGDNVQILNNKVVNSGYIGIKWQGNDVYVKYNYVDRFCTLRDDGAGIYSWEDPANPETRFNRNIISNIVVNGIGNNQGVSEASTTSVQGLYFDIGSKAVLADSNTVAYVANGSFHGNNCGSLTITNNTFFKSGRTYSLQRFADGEMIRKVVIKKNILYPYLFRYRNLGINDPATTKEADIRAFGTIDSNYYSVGPDKDTSLTTVTTNDDNSDYEEDWYGFNYLTQTVGIEKHSTKVDNTGTLEYNASNSARVVNFSGQSKKDVFGKVYNNSVTIPAWGSKILIPNGGTSTDNDAPVANAGANKLITLPVNTVTLTGTGTDPDGSITQYSWEKISGPDGPSISTPLLATTIIINLVEGVYEYELTVTDNSGTTGKDVVQVTVNASGSGSVYLRPASYPSPVTNGLDYKYYEGSFLILPTYNKLTPVKSGTVSNINLDNAERPEHFAFEFKGYISVPYDGVYTFYTNSDDGSKIYIDDALIVSNDGLHGPLETSGSTGLKAGKHIFRVIYFQRGGGTTLEVSYESDRISKRRIPSSALYRLTTTTARVAAVSTVASSATLNMVGTVDNNPAPVKGDLTISSYPNPSSTEFNLVVQGGTTEKIGITASDASGRIVFETTGLSNKNYNFGNKFLPGIYIIKVIQGNNVQTLKVMKL